GKRIDLPSTRRIIDAILNNTIGDVPYTTIPVFNLRIPTAVPGVPSDLLDPGKKWPDGDAWHRAASELAGKFVKNFSKFTTNTETAKLVSSGPKP
ncbi:MAG: phosphoenolpyruvate carboxykinase (ATP), partial [Bacteroidales bacterium]|nr:phosphoenolpyruvate carboxykinase (ATP) [Bacteroidales bacterium]